MIKIISWNVRHGLGQDEIVDIQRIGETLKSLNADIIALQEIDVDAKRSKRINQPEVLAEILGYDYHFTPFTKTGSGEYGLLTLSRLPMTRKTDLNIADLKCNNAAQLITFSQRQAKFDFVNLHAPWQYNKKYWKNFHKDYDFSECILCGDFNLLKENPAIIELKEKYQSLNESSTFCQGGTYDYTFLPKTYRLLSQNVIESTFSDHDMLVTTFDLW
jgi:endonuclease/exonuclease/phosphatase family metal-dependent hydrolase